MELMIRLQSEAQAAGGQVIPLLGNHEVMNTQGDWRYVHPEDITEFGSARDRQIALSPSGKYGKWLSSLDAVTVVQRTVFVHGGITPTMAKLGLDALNKGVHHEMFGSSKQVTGGDGPLWYRGFVQEPESTACPLLEQSLTLLDADRMVVGHTTQRSGVILSRCDGKLAVIDIGISDHYGSHLGYWESRQGDAIAVYPTKTVDIPDPRSE
jgi:hypothetical protein